MSEKVDQAQLMRYIELEKEIQGLESQNALKNYEVRSKAAADVKETIKSVEVTLQALTLATKKEKQDVDDMQKKSPNDIKSMFKDEASFNARLSKEQEEYLEAKNKEEVARQQLQDLKRQNQELESKAIEVKAAADKLTALYEERDNLLSDIFGGEYGSEKENMLEAQYDSLMDRKQRVSVANYKWTVGRSLLGEAVKQMAFATQKWVELKPVKDQHIRYRMTTETRNNNIAAVANLETCTRYLGPKITFPYLTMDEIKMLQKATDNIYNDLQTDKRYKMALCCYDVTTKRAAALLQWFDNVINETISKDLAKVSREAREVEKNLRAERIRLIREKIAESGGDVNAINDAGLKGMTDGFSHVDQTKLSDDDMDLKGVGITRPAPVGDDHGIPDAQQQMQDHMPPTPTPVPMSALPGKPSEEDLFGDISEIKEEYKRNTEEFDKTQQMNKARMEQGLQQKLAQRRHKRR